MISVTESSTSICFVLRPAVLELRVTLRRVHQMPPHPQKCNSTEHYKMNGTHIYSTREQHSKVIIPFGSRSVLLEVNVQASLTY